MAFVHSSSFTSSPFRAFPNLKTPSFLSRSTFPLHNLLTRRRSSLTASDVSFTWDDAFWISQPEALPDDPSDLRGYSDRIKACNRGVEMQSEFRPFVIEDQIVGYIHNRFAENLRSYRDVFTFLPGKVTLHSSLSSAEDRTRAVGDVIKSLGEESIPGIRNELYPVTSAFGAPVYFSLERAAAPYFGIKAYGIHMCGYVEKDGKKFLWLAKRSQQKPTYPGMLDHLVAGGLPHGVACGDNVVKECEEEAGIPSSISRGAVPVGAVSYMDINGYSYKRDVLFCYDLKLPESFMPENQDGEVESFKLIPVTHVANIIRRTQFFKPNCSLVIIDFLFRHGYISPECFGYLDLLQSLRSGSCS
ncbi:PREDICTED: nudix hydrolase 20, chloroplastic-like [Fragaria vesca subsp. vesca]|uniref:nudix hydrolase 20, chloroplastic-like n=1 Tax=Fragaria vesca subsp. vesca TaxID=101020 RepID=UPI0002C35403|nr:PREDICTED: nudix hydrolase 20, chloroplastic-like [Fragaria vesca subsp. vesca]